jgi:hypothetical protein
MRPAMSLKSKNRPRQGPGFFRLFGGRHSELSCLFGGLTVSGAPTPHLRHIA